VGASTLHNPRLDKAYSDFIAGGTGVIERLYRHGSFRLEVSQEIDHGSSWQLGVFLAHGLHAAARLAEKNQTAGTVVWATGEVRYDLSVGPVGHVEDKLRLSLQHLKSLAAEGRRVVVALPKVNVQGVDASLSELRAAGIQVLELERVSELANEVGIRIPTGSAASAEPKPGARWRSYAYFAGAGLACAAAAALGFVFYSRDDHSIVLTLPKTQFVVGEPFVFTVRSSRTCPFVVLTVDATGESKSHEPAGEPAFMGDPMLTAGERRRIPVQGVATIDPPAGTYQIAAVCKDELARLGITDWTRRTRRNFHFKVQQTSYAIDREELDKVAVTYEVKNK